MADEFDDPQPEERPAGGAGTEEADGPDDDGEDEGQGAAAGLFDPATLPAELQPHWERMQHAYEQRVEQVRRRESSSAELERKAALVDRFYQDPAYARSVLQARARQLGPGDDAPQPRADAVPASVLQAAEDALPEDLRFLAPAMARVAWQTSQQSVLPLHEERRLSAQEKRQEEIDRLALELETRAPDWGSYEDEMTERWNFLKAAMSGSGPLSHPRFGSVMELLYTWTTGAGKATAEAGRRMGQAARNRTRAGTGTSTRAPDVVAQIQAAPDDDTKWRLAYQAAVAEARRQGR